MFWRNQITPHHTKPRAPDASFSLPRNYLRICGWDLSSVSVSGGLATRAWITPCSSEPKTGQATVPTIGSKAGRFVNGSLDSQPHQPRDVQIIELDGPNSRAVDVAGPKPCRKEQSSPWGQIRVEQDPGCRIT